MAIDPVCGMEVDPSQAMATTEFQGRTYYFCSTTCKEEFDRNPQIYAQQQAA